MAEALAPSTLAGWVNLPRNRRRFCVCKGNRMTLSADESMSDIDEDIEVAGASYSPSDNSFEISDQDNRILTLSPRIQSFHRFVEFFTNQPKEPTVTDFTFLNMIGEGHSGRVVLAKHDPSGMLYAIKVISREKRKLWALNERNIALELGHPFIANIVTTFENEKNVFLVMEFMIGGDLGFHIRRQRRFSESQIRLYLAEIALALTHLHKLGIVYRDLKPGNILLDSCGHIKLVDFGLAKSLCNGEKEKSFCGTNEYIAPEMIEGAEYGFAVDWWAFGVVAYELMFGITPFRSENVSRLFDMIIKRPFKLMGKVDQATSDFLTRLLAKKAGDRLGCGELGEEEIFYHPYFQGINWEAVYEKTVTPQFVPQQSEDSLANFDPSVTKEQIPSIEDGW